MSLSTEREPLLASQHPRHKQSKHLPHGPREISRSTRYFILAGVWMSTFLSSINMSLVPTMLPAISSQFHKSNQASWLGTSYLLATCTFTPLYGRLCNVMGRRRANQSAVFFAALGTLLCGFSTSMEMLIVARFISGIGGGATYTTATIVINDMYSLRTRGLAQGFQSLFNGLGIGLGGPLGGLLTDLFGWRFAFLVQIPLWLLSAILTQAHLRYVTPGKGRSTLEVIRRIDYFGSLSLLLSVGGLLFFLSAKYNDLLAWTASSVIAPLVVGAVSFVSFIFLEIFVVPEPVLAPFLLKQYIPVLIGMSNFLVAMSNFSITYYFPMWFQTVMLTSASTAGLHLLPSSISMSTGSLFAGWSMHRTGKYKALNLIFGILPFISTLLILMIHPHSGFIQSWLSIIPMGFGNAIILQTTLIALLAHIPETHMAVGTGFGQVFRGVGQVCGVAVSSAIFQSKLSEELHQRILGEDSEELISKIRTEISSIVDLPPDIQASAQASYDTSLKWVFAFASAGTLLGYFVRLPIPEKSLDTQEKAHSGGTPAQHIQPVRPELTPIQEDAELLANGSVSLSLSSSDEDDADGMMPTPAMPMMARRRRLSMYEPTEGLMDLEGERFGGSARLVEPGPIISASAPSQVLPWAG